MEDYLQYYQETYGASPSMPEHAKPRHQKYTKTLKERGKRQLTQKSEKKRQQVLAQNFLKHYRKTKKCDCQQSHFKPPGMPPNIPPHLYGDALLAYKLQSPQLIIHLRIVAENNLCVCYDVVELRNWLVKSFDGEIFWRDPATGQPYSKYQQKRIKTLWDRVDPSKPSSIIYAQNLVEKSSQFTDLIQ